MVNGPALGSMRQGRRRQLRLQFDAFEDVGVGFLLPVGEVVPVGDVGGLGVEHPVLTPAAGLATQHRLRTEVRRLACDPLADDHVVAAATRSVNAAEVACAVLIDRIDVWAATALTESHTTVVHTESLGQLVDRLAELWMRWQLFDADDHSVDRVRGRAWRITSSASCRPPTMT
jgi:hypothetical protein